MRLSKAAEAAVVNELSADIKCLALAQCNKEQQAMDVYYNRFISCAKIVKEMTGDVFQFFMEQDGSFALYKNGEFIRRLRKREGAFGDPPTFFWGEVIMPEKTNAKKKEFSRPKVKQPKRDEAAANGYEAEELYWWQKF